MNELLTLSETDILKIKPITGMQLKEIVKFVKANNYQLAKQD